jgi:hypothetical protein
MKKIFTLFLVSLTFGISAQSFSAYQTNNAQTINTATLTNGSYIVDNTSVTTNTASPTLSTFKVKLVNNSASTLTLSVIRRVIYQSPALQLDGLGNIPDTYFCFGFQCFPSNVSSPGPADYCVLGPSGSTSSPYDNSKDNGTPFVIDLAEGLTKGKYYVNYTVFDINNLNDSICFTVKYNPFPSLEAWTVDAAGTSTIVTLQNGTAVTHTTSPSATTEVKVKFKNIDPTSTYTYSVIRKDVVLNSVTSTTTDAKAHFCFGDLGSCYDENTFEPSSDFTTLGPGGETSPAKQHLFTELDEATAIGYSEVYYKLFNMATGKMGADTLSFTFKYNSLTGINENKGIIENISNVYPSPSTGYAAITVVLTDEVPVKVQVFNSLGALVYSGAEQQLNGKNKLSIDCSTLNSGLYFITVNAGNAKITKRLVVNK